MSQLPLISGRRFAAAATALALAVGTVLVGSASAQAFAPNPHPGSHDSSLTPQTHFTMQPDGSSGATVGGEHIPNIDIVKKTIATYYGDPGTGIANKTASPYITEMNGIVAQMTAQLPALYAASLASGKTPAIVLDTDDTMLMTYDREVGEHALQLRPGAEQHRRAERGVPGDSGDGRLRERRRRSGLRRDRDHRAQRGAAGGVHRERHERRLHRLHDRRTTSRSGRRGAQPSYITCAAASCTTVEFKAGTRKHLEDTGYDIALNVGDQWSDLQGGSADHTVKLPNPTYYLPSPDLPGMSEPQLAPRTTLHDGGGWIERGHPGR